MLGGNFLRLIAGVRGRPTRAVTVAPRAAPLATELRDPWAPT